MSMSDLPPVPPPLEPPPDENAPLPPPPRRDGCLTAFMVVVGLVLLFPGICFLAFASNAAPLGLIGFVLIGSAIFLFIRAATPPKQ